MATVAGWRSGWGEPLGPAQAAAFLLAAWAVLANDSLQTLGPFLAANRGRTPRLLQGLFLGAVLCGVLWLGWWRGEGDASWGRLEQIPLPGNLGWSALLPPLAVLLLTRIGAPVSTSFLVLTAFRPSALPDLLRQSLLGYGLALTVAAIVYGAALLWRRPSEAHDSAPQESTPHASGAHESVGQEGRRLWPWTAQPSAPEPAAAAGSDAPGSIPPQSAVRSNREAGDATAPRAAQPPPASPGGPPRPIASGAAGPAGGALALQWLATGWLWSQWLIQDLANLYVYLPRRLPAPTMALSLVVLCSGMALLLAENGGAIQAIVARKRGLQDPAASTGLSLVYGLVLAALAASSRQPLSTTWVFLGLLAGRELALLLAPQARNVRAVLQDLGRDLALAGLGLAVSLAVALALQPLP